MHKQIYRVAECFYSLQGEGVRAGCPSVFLRFSGCNIGCTKEEAGFDCDTDYRCKRQLTFPKLVDLLIEVSGKLLCRWVVLTGGEPGLQITEGFVDELQTLGFLVGIESNGTVTLPRNLDWICISPKKTGPPIKQAFANEVKFVVAAGDPLPACEIEAEHYLLSPAYERDNDGNILRLSRKNLDHAIKLCLDNPRWRLSQQLHKVWGIR